ncbi:hypothetical protein NDU88_004556 [Pleurodeles waltl]|uniref:Uncharacterized protein n=1 Tax=Pleurodeles waltl TaxID=8319 RepID=A0AAV7W5B3_PLEWA|nr:hypothetical protein NDU88_004556 [Pleurodeles waltl]
MFMILGFVKSADDVWVHEEIAFPFMGQYQALLNRRRKAVLRLLSPVIHSSLKVMKASECVPVWRDWFPACILSGNFMRCPVCMRRNPFGAHRQPTRHLPRTHIHTLHIKHFSCCIANIHTSTRHLAIASDVLC